MSNITLTLPDREKVNLNKYDLFDKIINLKLITGDYTDSGVVKKDEYFIRSDYEIFYPSQDITKVMQTGNIASNSYQIRRCQMKPSIKVQYTNVCQSTSIDVDIFISNFYMTDSQGQRLMNFNNSTYPLAQVEIMMGYWGQFKDMPHNTFEDLKKFEVMNGADKIVITAEYVTTDKLPPDYTLHIHGYVGNRQGGEGAKNPLKEYSEIESSPYMVEVEDFGNGSGQSALERLFFQHITRRFLRESVTDRKLSYSDGFMSVADAKEYGIRVFCSEGVRKLSADCISKKIKNSDGEEVKKKVYFNAGVTADKTFSNIRSNISNKLIKKTLKDGNWIVFLEEESLNPESIDEVIRKEDSVGVITKEYKNVLPAVYNINIDVQATIVAPFFYFVNVFDFVYFQNRYALTNLVSYYTGSGAQMNKFSVIQQSVSFATVEDINEMTLRCVSNTEEAKGV